MTRDPAYERRRAQRQAERERGGPGGETLAEFHARENPAPTAPGAGIPRVRCSRTPNLFGDRDDHANLDLFKEPK